MSDKLDKLRQERDKAERHLRKAANDEKALAHEMARLTRAERTHRLCARGGMLEIFIREPSLLTDDDVMELLTFLFHGEAAQKKLGMLIERRRETAGRETCKTLGSGQGRNYTPINRCVAFSEGPCRGLDVHSGMASIPIQGALRSPCAGFASYPFAD